MRQLNNLRPNNERRHLRRHCPARRLHQRLNTELLCLYRVVFFARRDEWSRPLPLGAPRPMSFVKSSKCNS